MEWQDKAIILKAIRCSEYDAVITIYSKSHGKINGIVKGAYSRRLRPSIEIGNTVDVIYRVRTEGQLGRLQIDVLQSHSVPFLSDSGKLLAFNSALSLLDMATIMGQSYEGLYQDALNLFVVLDSPYWMYGYCKWEISLLAIMGYGLDLSKCVVSGTRDDLIYVSPKSGRAVSSNEGQIYKKKLLTLPEFLLNPKPDIENIPYEAYYNSLLLSLHFIKKFVFDCGKDNIPHARIRFNDWVYNRI